MEELRLSHFSVKEYLVSDCVVSGSAYRFALNEIAAHRSLADLCICYLLRYDHHDPDIEPANLQESPQPFESDPFAPYAAIFWWRHLKAARYGHISALHHKSEKLVTDTALLAKIIDLLQPWFSPLELDIFNCIGRWRLKGTSTKSSDDVTVSPLCHASGLGLDHHIFVLMGAGEDVDSLGPKGAAFFDRESTVKLLLENGAAVDARRLQNADRAIYTMTALHSAVAGGHEDIIHMLLIQGTDANSPRTHPSHCPPMWLRSRIPLQTAVSISSVPIVQNLPSRGADVNAEGGNDGNALLIALARSDALVRILLEARAELNISSGPYQT